MITIKKILKQLTPERIEKEIKAVKRVRLPREIRGFVEEYEKVGERSEFFWQFMLKGNRMFSFLEIPQKYKIAELKFLVTMFIILFDDVADQTKDSKLLDNLLRIVLDDRKDNAYQGLSKKQKKYLNFTVKLWQCINQKIKRFPSHSKFEKIFKYDIHQTLNALKYSSLINENPYLINKTEYWLYAPHTLQGMINCSLDLMCFYKINLKELGKIREIFWNAQKMGRISNCISTWKNEFNEEDFSSTILAYAIDYELINVNDLYKKDKTKLITKIDNSIIKKELLKEWESHYDKINSLCNEVKLIKSSAILKQLESLLIIYLSVSKFYEHRYSIQSN